MKEYWKNIKGYEELYQVSNNGYIKSLKRISWNGKGYHEKKEMILKIQFDGRKYPQVTLSINGKIKTFRIHNLVANAFIPNPLNKRTINHIDGNKSNNHISNLEWNTYSENNQHAYDTGLKNMRGMNKSD